MHQRTAKGCSDEENYRQLAGLEPVPLRSMCTKTELIPSLDV